MNLTDDMIDHAYEIAERIGHAMRASRHAAAGGCGESQEAVVRSIPGANMTDFGRIERGANPNVMLANAARYLGHFDLTLVVVPRAVARQMDAARARTLAHERACCRHTRSRFFTSSIRSVG